MPNNAMHWVLRAVASVAALCLGVWLAIEKPHLLAPRGADRASRNVIPTGQPEGAASHAPPSTESPPVGTGGTDSSVADVASTLVLIRTHPGERPDEGYAELGADPSNPQSLMAGAVLVNGARLAEIYSNRVVLERAGRRATLFIAGPAFKSAQMNATTTAAEIPEQERVKLANGDLKIVSVGAERPHLIDKPTGQRSGFIRAEQHSVDGIVQGYRVTPGAQSDQFSRLGLRAGDVVTALDGVPVDSDSKLAEFVALVARDETHAISVIRGEAREPVLLEPAAASPQPYTAQERLPSTP